MAGKMEDYAESFIVKIDVGASELFCTAYFNRPDLIIRCKWCHSIPNVLYTSDKISQFCKSCFVRRLKGLSGLGSTERATHEQIPGFVTFNEALRDAAVKCPGCHRTGQYTELENHMAAEHPHLLNSGQQHTSSEVQLVNGVGPPPGFGSRQQAVHKLEEGSHTKEELQSYTECSPPEDSKTKGTSNCEMQRYGNCPESSAGTCAEETGKPGNTDSDTTQCMSPSIFLDPNQTQEEAKRTVLMFLECQKWFQAQLLKYYEKHLKDCYTPEEEMAKNIREHVEKCPRVSSMQLNWFTKALSKYREHRNKQCSRCTESCSNFLEHAKHCEEFCLELKTLCTDEMFEFYQQHANGCPGSIDANGTPENTSSCKQTLSEKEADEDAKPVTTKPDKLPEYLQGEQTVAQEHCKTVPQYMEAGVREKTHMPAEHTVCPICLEAWDSQEISDHAETCATSVRKKCHSQVIVAGSQQHSEQDCPGGKQSSISVEEVDKDNEKQKRKTEVADLKKKVKELEERLQEIERPLLKLIKRLEEGK